MANPVGELEDLIERALADGPERQLSAVEVAQLLAARIAPEVVLRSQLDHVGWTDDKRATFCIPPRVVTGTSEMVVQFAAGGND